MTRAQEQHLNDRSSILVFDVNETLLDISPLEPLFAQWFGDGGVMRSWFGELVLYSQALTLAGRYDDFGMIGAAMLGMTARIHGCDLPPDAEQRLKSTIGRLPAHSDVAPGLKRLRDAGFRLVTLTNSGAQTQRQQLDNAGIADLFERQFSVEAVKAFKPARATYNHVADALEVPTTALTMIACHSWDLVGARAAGCATAFVRRPGNSQPDLAEVRAGHQAETIEALADLIISARAAAARPQTTN